MSAYLSVCLSRARSMSVFSFLRLVGPFLILSSFFPLSRNVAVVCLCNDCRLALTIWRCRCCCCLVHLLRFKCNHKSNWIYVNIFMVVCPKALFHVFPMRLNKLCSFVRSERFDHDLSVCLAVHSFISLCLHLGLLLSARSCFSLILVVAAAVVGSFILPLMKRKGSTAAKSLTQHNVIIERLLILPLGQHWTVKC